MHQTFTFSPLESIAKRQQHLMALVAHLRHTRSLDIDVGLERMEVTVGGAVLIGKIDIHASSLDTQTTGETMGILPVYIVSR